jgi:O-antigen ligase
VPALAASLLVVERGSRRLAFLGASAATALVMLRPRPNLGRRGWLALGSLAVAVTAVALWSGAVQRTFVVWKGAFRTAEAGDRYSAVDAAAGSRLVLAHAAIDMGSGRPLLGNGRGSFKALLRPWLAEQRAEHPGRKAGYERLTSDSLNDAHNALLNAFAEGGVPAALLLGTALLGTGLRLWPRGRTAVPASVAFALYSAILLGMVCQPITAKAPGAIIAVCLAISGIDRRVD